MPQSEVAPSQIKTPLQLGRMVDNMAGKCFQQMRFAVPWLRPQEDELPMGKWVFFANDGVSVGNNLLCQFPHHINNFLLLRIIDLEFLERRLRADLL